MTTELRPRSRRFWVTREMLAFGGDGLPNPRFNVEETAKIFFAKSGSWLRFRMRPSDEHPDTWLVLDGKPIQIQRKNPADDQSHRVFSLAEIEPMAWSLHAIELAEIDRARSEMQARQAVELTTLTTEQQAEAALEKNQTERMRQVLAERHPRKRDQLAEKHAAQRTALDERLVTAERQLAATIALVRAEADLYGILTDEDDNNGALAA
jgi:hypothetical protein